MLYFSSFVVAFLKPFYGLKKLNESDYVGLVLVVSVIVRFRVYLGLILGHAQIYQNLCKIQSNSKIFYMYLIGWVIWVIELGLNIVNPLSNIDT